MSNVNSYYLCDERRDSKSYGTFFQRILGKLPEIRIGSIEEVRSALQPQKVTQKFLNRAERAKMSLGDAFPHKYILWEVGMRESASVSECHSIIHHSGLDLFWAKLPFNSRLKANL